MAVGVGGLGQLIAGMWEFASGNVSTFHHLLSGAETDLRSSFPFRLSVLLVSFPARTSARTSSDRLLCTPFIAFSLYGGFWISFALIFLPGSGITAAYTDMNEFHAALGFYVSEPLTDSIMRALC